MTVVEDSVQPDRRAPELERGSRVTSVLRLQATPIVSATILLFILSATVVPRSVTTASLLAMIVPASVMAVAAIGQTLVVQQKGIDLSAAGTITLSAVVFAAASRSGIPFLGVVVITALSCAAAGLLNGLLITRLRITPIVATLASNSLIFGAVWTVSAGTTATAPGDLVAAVSGNLGPLPVITWITLALVVIAALVMSRTTIGRRFTGVGASPASARASGVNTSRYVVGAYVASAVFCGLAGVLLLGYLGNTSLTLGTSYQLPVIAAVVVGGAVLTGGKGSVIASATAALFLAQIVQVVLTLGAPNSIQLLVQSIALAVAASLRLVLDRREWRRRSTKAALPAKQPAD